MGVQAVMKGLGLGRRWDEMKSDGEIKQRRGLDTVTRTHRDRRNKRISRSGRM